MDCRVSAKTSPPSAHRDTLGDAITSTTDNTRAIAITTEQ